MKPNFWNFLLYSRNVVIWFFIFGALIVLKLPTIFYKDYYDPSVIGVISYLIDNPANNIYEYIIKFSITKGGYLLLRVLTLVVIALTSVFVFLLTRKIYSSRVAFISTIIYSLFISSFGPSFLGFSQEILLSLFFMLGFYSFYMIEFENKNLYILTLFISIILSLLTSFKGLYVMLSLIFYILIARPLWVFRKNKDDVSRYFLLISIITGMIVVFFIIDWFTTNVVVNDSFKLILSNYYESYIKRNLIFFIPNLVHKSFVLAVFHFVLWFFGIKGLINFFKDKVKRAKEFYIISILIFLVFTVLISGFDIKLKSFILLYPILSVLAGFQVFEKVKEQKLRKTIFILFVIPVLFFFIWNLKEVIVGKDNKISYTFNTIIGEDTKEYNNVINSKNVFEFIKKESALVYPYSDYLRYFGYLDGFKINFVNTDSLFSLKNKVLVIDRLRVKDSKVFDYLSSLYYKSDNIGDYEVWRLKE